MDCGFGQPHVLPLSGFPAISDEHRVIPFPANTEDQEPMVDSVYQADHRTRCLGLHRAGEQRAGHDGPEPLDGERAVHREEERAVTRSALHARRRPAERGEATSLISPQMS